MHFEMNGWDEKFARERERLHRIDREVADGTMELLDYETTMAEKYAKVEDFESSRKVLDAF